MLPLEVKIRFEQALEAAAQIYDVSEVPGTAFGIDTGKRLVNVGQLLTVSTLAKEAFEFYRQYLIDTGGIPDPNDPTDGEDE